MNFILSLIPSKSNSHKWVIINFPNEQKYKRLLALRQVTKLSDQPIAYSSFYAQRDCEYIFREVFGLLHDRDDFLFHEYNFVIADEDYKYCTIIFNKCDDLLTFVAVVVKKIEPTDWTIQISRIVAMIIIHLESDIQNLQGHIFSRLEQVVLTPTSYTILWGKHHRQRLKFKPGFMIFATLWYLATSSLTPQTHYITSINNNLNSI